MSRSSKKQGRSATQCNHSDKLNLSECLGLLKTLSTAQRIHAAFYHSSKALATFVDLCGQEPCTHFKRAFMDDMLPGLCLASARALQLLHSSGSVGLAAASEQTAVHLLAVSELLSSLHTCYISGKSGAASLSLVDDDPARTRRQLAGMKVAGGSYMSLTCGWGQSSYGACRQLAVPVSSGSCMIMCSLYLC